MSIRNAVYLLNAIEKDEDLRRQLYRCSNRSQLDIILNPLGYVFDNNEFEDAVNSMHVQCQTLENAQALMHKAELIRFLLFTNEEN